ncbi:MAG: methylated-DNA--[protein]-cysteine S-methyltransferase [Pseudomonadota bacterium]
MGRAETVACVETPVGHLCLWADAGRLTRLTWDDGPRLAVTHPKVLRDAAAQLGAYFAGDLRAFSVPLALGPGAFQARFQQALIDIPLGETRTYGELAAELRVSAQAVGQACGANRLPVIVPCHRVLGRSGLGGFSGGTGVETKVALLKLEGAAGLLI